MRLNLYRRHGSHCPGGRALHATTYEADELRRGWRKCVCPIYASGTLGGKFKRKNTERTTWSDAKTVTAEWELHRSWPSSGNIAPLVLPSSGIREKLDAEDIHEVTIAEAVESYMAVRIGSGITEATLRKHRTFTKQLTAFGKSKGYVFLRQFSALDIDSFYANWKLGLRTKGHALGTLRGVFRFCVNREWLAKSPVTSDLKPPVGTSRVANKIPFTDEELQRIIAACDRIETTSWSNGQQQGTWTGNDVRDFIWFLVHTRLRISDGARFDVRLLRGNEIFLRAKKNGGDVFTWVPDWLRDRLAELRKERGSRPFLSGSSERLETVTDLWRRKINRVFELAGQFEESPTPHRFRHTFARILLQRGVPAADVADLLGDDENTVRRHYARWVPERQARLSNILREAFGPPGGF